MAQDIRELLKQDKRFPIKEIGKGHQERFLSRLEKELPAKKSNFNYGWLKIVASIVVLFSVSLTYLYQNGDDKPDSNLVEVDPSKVKNATVILDKQISPLAKISPDYEKAENYFLTSINFELSKIKVNEKNREIVESFKIRLDKLNNEYQKLNKELIEVGPNRKSVEAMMENLTLRLALLNRLKDKLKELENIDNEMYSEIQA